MLERSWIEQALWDMKQGHRKMSDYTPKQRHALYVFRSGRRGVTAKEREKEGK